MKQINTSDIKSWNIAKKTKNIKAKPLAIRGELKPVRYTRNGKESIGFIAQDVQELYPELVKENADGMLSLNYQQLTAVLYAELKELRSRIKQLEG